MRAWSITVAAAALAWLSGCPDEELPPPPIAGTFGSNPGVIGVEGGVAAGVDGGATFDTQDTLDTGGLTLGTFDAGLDTLSPGAEGFGTFGLETFGTFGPGIGTLGPGIGTLDGGAVTLDGGVTFGGVPGPVPTELLVSGLIFEGEAEWPLPLRCAIRLHEADAVFDPGTGVSGGFSGQVLVTINAFPFPYIVTNEDVVFLGPGDLVYVQAVCDPSGDGFDEVGVVGAWFPGLPAEPVILPSTDVDLALALLPF